MLIPPYPIAEFVLLRIYLIHIFSLIVVLFLIPILMIIVLLSCCRHHYRYLSLEDPSYYIILVPSIR